MYNNNKNNKGILLLLLLLLLILYSSINNNAIVMRHMIKVSREINRAIAAMADANPVGATCERPLSGMNVRLPDREVNLMQVLSEKFSNSGEDFATNLISNALTETVKTLPRILGRDRFDSVEDDIIEAIGFDAYLSYYPVFSFKRGIEVANFAEISNLRGTFLGHWRDTAGFVNIEDPASGEILFSYDKRHNPQISGDRVTWQWGLTNIRPVRLTASADGLLLDQIDDADIISINEEFYFFREESFSDELKFRSFVNTNQENIKPLKKQLADAGIYMHKEEGGLVVVPTTLAIDLFKGNSDKNCWEYSDINLHTLSLKSVVVDTDLG